MSVLPDQTSHSFSTFAVRRVGVTRLHLATFHPRDLSNQYRTLQLLMRDNCIRNYKLQGAQLTALIMANLHFAPESTGVQPRMGCNIWRLRRLCDDYGLQIVTQNDKPYSPIMEELVWRGLVRSRRLQVLTWHLNAGQFWDWCEAGVCRLVQAHRENRVTEGFAHEGLPGSITEGVA